MKMTAPASNTALAAMTAAMTHGAIERGSGRETTGASAIVFAICGG